MEQLATEPLRRLDRVRIGNRQVLIVTGYHPNRPANCYSGVPENGHTEYRFGSKHRPQKIGVVTEDHPALLRLKSKLGVRQLPDEQPPTTVDPNKTTVIIGLSQLLMAIEANNFAGAKKIADDLHKVDVLGFLRNM